MLINLFKPSHLFEPFGVLMKHILGAVLAELADMIVLAVELVCRVAHRTHVFCLVGGVLMDGTGFHSCQVAEKIMRVLLFHFLVIMRLMHVSNLPNVHLTLAHVFAEAGMHSSVVILVASVAH